MTDAQALLLVALLSAAVIGGALWLRRARGGSSLRARELLMSNPKPIGLTVGGALIGLTGTAMTLHANLSVVHDVDLAAIERGAAFPGSFIRVVAHPHPDALVCREIRGRTSCYTPLTSGEGRTVAILLSGEVPTRAPARFTGAVVPGGELDLPRRLRAMGLVPAPTLVRLTRESPRDRSLAGSVVALAGIGILVAGLAWLRRRRAAVT